MEERYTKMVRKRNERLGRSKEDKAVDFSMAAGPGTTRPDLAEVEDVEHSQMHSPMDANEDAKDGQMEDDKSSSGPLSSDDRDDSDDETDDSDDDKGLQQKTKRQRIQEIKCRPLKVRSEAAKILLSALNDPNDPGVSEPRMTKMARYMGMRAG